MTAAINACRICGSRALRPILSLGEQPLANRLLSAAQLDDPEPVYPLDLVLCPGCSLVQITETVPPEMLFGDYAYFSSYSDTMLAHARRLADELSTDRRLDANSLVVELASNDGYLLQYFKGRGIPVLGIEPAANIARAAEARGISTINEFFDEQLSGRLTARGRAADVIIANNVLAHVAPLHSFVAGVAALLKPAGLAVFESAYVRDTVDNGEFDQIYHEHLCYYSVTAQARLFALHDLEVVDAARLPIHGGSIRVYVQHPGTGSRTDRLWRLLEEEARWGVSEERAYESFASAVADKRRTLLQLLDGLKASGKRIAAYGAAAKAAILLNTFGIGPDVIDYIVDRSAYKQGRYMPGCHLAIYPPERIASDKPDYLLVLAWNVADEVMRQQDDYLRRGGTFIIPAPRLRVITGQAGCG